MKFILLGTVVLCMTSHSKAVTIDSYLQPTAINVFKSSAADTLSESQTANGITASVNVTASETATAVSYAFTADGETSVSGLSGGAAKAKVGCEIDPAGYWSYVTRNIVGFQVNNPYNGLKKFVFKEPMKFTCSFSVGGVFPPLAKGLIQSETGKLTWMRADGTRGKETLSGSQPLEIITGGEPNGYSETCHGTVGPGTYFIGAAAVWVAYGADGNSPCKGPVSFRVNFTPEPKAIGKVQSLQGTCKLHRDGATYTLKDGDPVYVGDLVRSSSKSMVKILFQDDSRITLGPESSIRVEAFDKKSPGVINLLKGAIRGIVKKNLDELDPDAKAKLFIKTSNGGIGIRGTDFKIAYSEQDGIGTSKLDVTEGLVELIDYNGGDITWVGAGQSGEVTGPIGKSVPTLAPEISVYDLKAKELISGSGKTNFGTAIAGDGKSEKYFRIRNIWTDNLSNISVSLEGEHADDFRIFGPGVDTLQGGASTEFAVKFKPSAEGLRTATLKIASNDADENPFEIHLIGTGTAPGPDIDVMQPLGSHLSDGASKRQFGTLDVGKSGNSKTFTIRNKGSTNLSDINVSLQGKHASDFMATKPDLTTLAPGASTRFRIVFKPTSKGTRSATLNVMSNDADEASFDILLYGTGAE